MSHGHGWDVLLFGPFRPEGSKNSGPQRSLRRVDQGKRLALNSLVEIFFVESYVQSGNLVFDGLQGFWRG